MKPTSIDRPRKRRRLVRIVIASILCLLILEPIVMYRKLARQRDARSETRTQVSELLASP